MNKFPFHIIITCTILMSIFGCFGKKKENLASWLDKNFPGRYEVLDNHRSLMDRIKYSKKVRAVVGSKEDPDIQFTIDWYKDTSELGITKNMIDAEYQQSKEEVTRARELFHALSPEEAQHVSVGVLEDAVYFLVFAEPDTTTRKKYLQNILDLFRKENSHPQKNIFIEFMEDSAYHKEFNDIVPAGYWSRIDSYHTHNNTVSLDFEWKEDLSVDELMKHWMVNTESNRSTQYREKAYEIAQKWAEKHLSKPYYIDRDQMVGYELDEENPMSIHFHFPYYAERPADENADLEGLRKGYVSGVYLVDEETFTKIEKGTEL